jgi:hypothetical protein
MSNPVDDFTSFFVVLALLGCTYHCEILSMYYSLFSLLLATTVIFSDTFLAMAKKQTDSRKQGLKGGKTEDDDCLLSDLQLEDHESSKESTGFKIFLLPIKHVVQLVIPVWNLGTILLYAHMTTKYMSSHMQVYEYSEQYSKNSSDVETTILSTLGVIKMPYDFCTTRDNLFHSIACYYILEYTVMQTRNLQQQHIANFVFLSVKHIAPENPSYLQNAYYLFPVVFDLVCNTKTMVKNITVGLLYMTFTFFLTLMLRVNHCKLFDALVHWETVVYFIAGIVLWGVVLIIWKQIFENSEQSEDAPERKVRVTGRSKSLRKARCRSPAR